MWGASVGEGFELRSTANPPPPPPRWFHATCLKVFTLSSVLFSSCALISPEADVRSERQCEVAISIEIAEVLIASAVEAGLERKTESLGA